MSALITSGKSHTRCFVSVGGINTSLAQRRFEYTQTCSLLIATLRIVAANLYSLYKLHCRFTNPVVCICTYPADITCVSEQQNYFPTLVWIEQRRERLQAEFSHPCWQLLQKHQYYCFFFFFLTRQMFTHNMLNKHASVSSPSLSTNC